MAHESATPGKKAKETLTFMANTFELLDFTITDAGGGLSWNVYILVKITTVNPHKIHEQEPPQAKFFNDGKTLEDGPETNDMGLVSKTGNFISRWEFSKEGLAFEPASVQVFAKFIYPDDDELAIA